MFLFVILVMLCLSYNAGSSSRYTLDQSTLHRYRTTHVCMHACIHACMYVCMYACRYVCMSVCIYFVCMYVSVVLIVCRVGLGGVG